MKTAEVETHCSLTNDGEACARERRTPGLGLVAPLGPSVICLKHCSQHIHRN